MLELTDLDTGPSNIPDIGSMQPLNISMSDYYVYALAHPDGRVFYIGRGTGNRIDCHEKEARSNKITNSYKIDVIKEIWENGSQVTKTKLAYFTKYEDAVMYETALIFFMGEHLTNIKHGSEGGIPRRYDKLCRPNQHPLTRERALNSILNAMSTLKELRINLGWTIHKLAEEAGISRQAVSDAEKGIPIRAGTIKAITDALSQAYDQEIRPSEIEGVNIL